jgi:6-phosphogluconate dehydrogenase
MWTSISALELNVPIPTIDVSVSMRYISSLKEIRVKASGSFEEKPPLIINDKQQLKSLCKDALLFSFALSYGQGLHLLTAASDFYSYKISIPTITRIWKGGCIIRSSMLNDLQLAYEKEKALPNIIHSDIFKQKFLHQRKDVSDLVKMAIDAGIPVAALSASLQYFNAFVTAELPANLIQAQRDFFGAHTYERKDREGIFHSNWEE